MSQLSDVRAGLEVLAAYDKGEAHVCAEHDEIFVGGPAPKQMQAADVTRLEELGFDWDEDTDSWHRYV